MALFCVMVHVGFTAMLVIHTTAPLIARPHSINEDSCTLTSDDDEVKGCFH